MEEHNDHLTSGLPVESNTQTYHGRVGTGWRLAERRGRAGTRSTGRRRNGSPKRKPPLLPSRRWKNNLSGVSPEARTQETPDRPIEELNPRFIRGLSAVYKRDEKRSSFLDADECTDAYLSL